MDQYPDQQITQPQKKGDFWTWLAELKVRNRRMYTTVVFGVWSLVPVGLLLVYLFVADGLFAAKVVTLPLHDYLANTLGSDASGPWVELIGAAVYFGIFLVAAIVNYRKQTAVPSNPQS